MNFDLLLNVGRGLHMRSLSTPSGKFEGWTHPLLHVLHLITQIDFGLNGYKSDQVSLMKMKIKMIKLKLMNK